MKKKDLKDIQTALANDLKDALKNKTATSADKRVALDLLKHNGILAEPEDMEGIDEYFNREVADGQDDLPPPSKHLPN